MYIIMISSRTADPRQVQKLLSSGGTWYVLWYDLEIQCNVQFQLEFIANNLH